MLRRNLIVNIRRQKIKLEIKRHQGAVEFDARIGRRLIIVAVSCCPSLSESIKKILKNKIWFFCLLSFGAESFVLQFAIQKFKD